MAISFKKKPLGIFSLVMINIIAVDSIRSLPFSAIYGFSIVFYYLISALVFFLPISLFAAELATCWPKKGGIYVWIREAFGERVAFVMTWIQWVSNIAWYPTILSLIGGSIAYLIHPELMNNKPFMLSVILIVYWGATFMNFFGMKVSGRISTIGAIVGTLFPMVFIIILGITWLITGNASQISFTSSAFIPAFSSIQHMVFLVAVLFGLVGIEMSSAHADEVEKPHKAYPKAIMISSIIILTTLVGSSLSIAIVVPKNKLNIISGVLEAYTLLLNAFNLEWITPLIALFIIIGGICSVAAWIIGPSKGLLVAAQDNGAFKSLKKVNKHEVPTNLLWIQGVIFTLICSIYLMIPTVSGSYWLLTAMTTQLTLLVYIGLFSAGIYLRYKKPDMQRDFQIPGGKPMLWSLGILGICTCLFAITLGFFPPNKVNVGNLFTYELILIIGILSFVIPPLLIRKKS